MIRSAVILLFFSVLCAFRISAITEQIGGAPNGAPTHTAHQYDNVQNNNSAYECPPDPMTVARITGNKHNNRIGAQQRRIVLESTAGYDVVKPCKYKACHRQLNRLFPANRPADLYVVRLRRLII
ncbi:MAG: hypothetical protein J6Y82_01045 [Bacteroidales bacterium]|nr:hypothetical protein [Bacteroidales bacterium]